MRQHWFAILLTIAVPTIIVQPFSPYTATGAFVALLWGAFIVLVLKICSWASGRQERARLLADADLQHAAMMRGDEYAGTFGRFPSAAAWSEGRPVTDASWIA